MKSKISLITILFCVAACGFMLFYIVKDYLIPTMDGSISDIPAGKIFSMEDVSPEIKDLLIADAKRHAYSQLSNSDKKAYEQLLSGFLSYADRIDIKKYELKLEGLQKIFSSITNDYPELFWLKNNCNIYTKGDLITDCIPEYIYSEADAKSIAKNLTQIRTMLVEPIKEKSEYEKIHYIFEYIVDYTSYDMDAYNIYMKDKEGADQAEMNKLDRACTIYGTLVGRMALCEGYAKTTQYLAMAAGIDIYYVTGRSKNEGHAWNVVNIEGQYYGLDTTWCDPRGQGDEKSYGYFLCDQETLNVDHSADVWYEVPACDGRTYNYFAYKGYELSVYDPKVISEMISRGYMEGLPVTEIKCINKSVYEALLNSIITQEIFECFDDIEVSLGMRVQGINYGVMEEINCIRISLTF